MPPAISDKVNSAQSGYLVNDGSLSESEVSILRPSFPNEPIDVLQRRYNDDGYLFLKGLIPRTAVLDCRREYFTFLSSTGVLKPDTDPVEGIYDAKNDGDGFPSIGAGPKLANHDGPGSFANKAEKAHTEEFYLNFSKHRALADFVARFTSWGADTLLLPRSLLRNNTPNNKAIGVHYDQIFLRHGEPTSITAWIPIGDIGLQGGGLIYLEHSDSLGQDFEEAFYNKAMDKGMSTAEYQNAYNANMMSSGWLGDGPMEFAAAYGGKWLVTAYEAGDVVLHKPHMIHASTINRDPENRIRLGTDLRFVNKANPYDKRWLHAYRFDDGL